MQTYFGGIFHFYKYPISLPVRGSDDFLKGMGLKIPLIVILFASINAGYLGFTVQSTSSSSGGQLKANVVGW